MRTHTNESSSLGYDSTRKLFVKLKFTAIRGFATDSVPQFDAMLR